MKQVLILLCLIPTLGISQSIFDDFDLFLKKHSVFGSVDYSSIKKNPDFLNEIVLKIEGHDLTNSSKDHKIAFYINAYNILVIKQVTQHYPIQSPLDVDGFFKKNKFIVAGESITLDQIEFDKLIKPSMDPRIHFSVSCAAKGCPPLDEHAFTPDQLDDQLNRRAHLVIGQPEYVYIDYSNQVVQLCKIFDWYSNDFTDRSESLTSYLNMYLIDKIPDNYKIEYNSYNWALNDR